MRVGIVSFAVGCLLSITSLQADVIRVIGGVHDLLPDKADQVVDLMVEGDGELQGMNLFVMIGSGKPAEAPAITGLDVIGAGMLFGSNNTGQGDSPGADMGYPGAWYAIVTTASDTVTPDPDPMTLARMTIDTTGFDAGTFAF